MQVAPARSLRRGGILFFLAVIQKKLTNIKSARLWRSFVEYIGGRFFSL
jgi:hypothetical protein